MSNDRVAGALFAVVGLGIGAWAGSEAIEAHRASGWPTTTGTIEESRGSNAKKPSTDTFHLTYRYTIDGAPYEGHTVRI